MIRTDTEVASGIARASGKSVLVEIFKTDVTNSILEIRLAAYCPIFGTQLLYETSPRDVTSKPQLWFLFHLPEVSTQWLWLLFRERECRSNGCDSCFVTGSIDPVVVTPVSRTGSIDPVVVTPVSWLEVLIQWLWLLFHDRKYRFSGCDSCFAYRKYRSSGCDSCFVTGSAGF